MREPQMEFVRLELSDLPYRKIVKGVGGAALAVWALQTYTATPALWDPTKDWAAKKWDDTVAMAREKLPTEEHIRKQAQSSEVVKTPTPAAVVPQPAEITAMYRTLNPEQRTQIDMSARILALGTIEEARQQNALSQAKSVDAIDGRFYTSDGEVVDPHALMFSYKDGPTVESMVHVQEEYGPDGVQTTVEMSTQTAHNKIYGEVRELVFKTPVRPLDIMYVSSSDYRGFTYADLVQRMNDTETVFESGFVVNKDGVNAATIQNDGIVLTATAPDYPSFRMGEVEAATDPYETMNQLGAIVYK